MRNHRVSRFSDLASIPTQDLDQKRYIFPGKVPGSLEADRVSNPQGQRSFSYLLHAQEPVKTSGGTARIVDSTNFPAASTIAAAQVEIEPGGLRELHWHPNNDEWQYYVEGSGRMTVFASDHQARTFDRNLTRRKPRVLQPQWLGGLLVLGFNLFSACSSFKKNCSPKHV